MIFTERTITIRNDSASINTPVILYRGDKNVEVRFTLVESPYKYSNRDSVNIIESTDAAYAQLIIKTPNDRDPIFGDITAVGQSNIIFVIEYGMIDEIGEVGEYDFQIRLFDSDQTSMVTLPEVVSGFIIKEPIAKEDTTNNITNSAIVGSAVVTSDVSIPTFVGGSYNKTAWHNGTVISRQKLDKIEDGIYETYELSKVNNSQIKEKANLNEVKEEISKAQLEGSGVDTTNFATKSDIDFIKNSVFEKEIIELNGTSYKHKYVTINYGKIEFISSSYYNSIVVDVNYKEDYLISSRMTNGNLYVLLYTDDNDNLIKSDLKGTNADVIYSDYKTTVPLGATKLYVTMQEENVYPTIKKLNYLEKIDDIENKVLNIENILYTTEIKTIDGNILVDSRAEVSNNAVTVSSSSYYNLIVVDVNYKEDYLISSRMTNGNLYVLLYTDDNNNLIKSDLKGTNADIVYSDYKTTVPLGATKLYVTTQEENNRDLPLIKKIEKTNKLEKEDYSNLIKIKDNFRYIVTTFSNASFGGDALILLGTNNLTTFDLIEKKGLYNAIGSRYFRDPSIIKINGFYYIMYTECGFDSGNKVGIIRTKNFLDFEELDLLELPSSETNYYQVWAPAWFREGEDIYIISSCRYNSSESFKTIIYKYDPDTHTATFMRIITEVIGHIDGHIYKENNKYYMAIGGAHMYVSDNLLGGYTKITNNNLDYTGYEANYCVKMDNGKWIMYMQELSETFGTSHMVYVTADSLDGVWSDPKPVTYTKRALNYIRSLDVNNLREYFHWTIFDFNNTLGNNNNF